MWQGTGKKVKDKLQKTLGIGSSHSYAQSWWCHKWISLTVENRVDFMDNNEKVGTGAGVST